MNKTILVLALVATFIAGMSAIMIQDNIASAAKAPPQANEMVVSYDLAPGADSALISIPVSDSPVFVMGVTATIGDRGVGQVTILHPSVAPFFIEWTGLDSTASSAITQGFSGIPGTKIVFIDFSHTVSIQVNDANSIRVHNGNSAQMTGQVTLIW